MSGYKNIDAYKKSFANVDKINQVIMLFDSAIAYIQQAKQAIIDKNIQERFNKTSKAFKIISGLRDALDHNSGGEIAAVLSDWYSGTGLRILSINRTEDLNMCDMCVKHISQMRDAWLEIEKQVKSGEVAEGGAQSSSESTGSTPAGNDFFETIAKAAYGASDTSGGMSISI